MPPSTPPTIISPKPKPASTKTPPPPLLLLQNNLQKILPRDPIEEILRKSSDSHIRSLLRSLCSSSQEIKEKAQQLHKQILELPVVRPPGINLSDGNYIVIPNKYNPRKRKPWNINNSGGTADGNNGGGGGGVNTGTPGNGCVVVGEETTGRRYRGQETYNRMMSSFYQTERNARRRFRFGRFEMGGSNKGGGDNDTKTSSSSSSRRKCQDQLSPTSNNNTSLPVSPRTKVLEMNPRDSIQQQPPPPAYSPPLSITSLDHIDYNNNQERVSTLQSEYHQCITTTNGNNNINIGGFAEMEPIRLPSINETIFRRTMSYSLELPPILGLGLEVNYNVMDAVTAELSYASMKGLEPGEIRSAAAGGLEF
ncbi:hypothetical protein TWF970_006992 [Orbilia oligospora]|uniref:Uncharacterized protein n=1 Tax=Orbilia oligospora TaxID=2813651 RepID=A0A7C8V3N3_ORBOL|nr:hypothetical protein TWF970_006992 [Orbilia oligospora]